MEMVEKTVNFESAPFQMGFMHTMARVLLIIGIEKKPSIVSLAECVCVCHTLTVNHPISIYGIPCVFYCVRHTSIRLQSRIHGSRIFQVSE